MSHSNTLLDLLASSQSQKEVTANSLLDAASPAMLFGRRASTTAALTWGYYGGTVLVAGVPTQIANGTVTLTANATNYVEADGAGVVSVNTAAFTSGRTALYTIITGAASVTSYLDQRTVGARATRRIAAPAWASAMTLDWNNADIYRITLGGNNTLSFAGGADGQDCILELTQDGTGSRTVTWPATARFAAGLPAPTLTTTAGKMDRVAFMANTGLNKYDCVAVIKGY